MSSHPLASPSRASPSSSSNQHNYDNQHRPASSSSKRPRSPPPDSRSSFEREFEARLFVTESIAQAAATSSNHNASVAHSLERVHVELCQSLHIHDARLDSLEGHVQNLGLHATNQDARIKALEARVDQLSRQHSETLQQHARQMDEQRAQLEHVKLTLTTTATNVLNCIEHESQIGHLVYVISERGRKMEEKLRSCEHQRIKAEAVLRSLTVGATSLPGYNALVEAGLHKMPELQQRTSQNKKDLLACMAARMKTDHGIDVIDPHTGAYKTPLFPRQPGQSPTANQRAAALAAKAEADELLRMTRAQ